MYDAQLARRGLTNSEDARQGSAYLESLPRVNSPEMSAEQASRLTAARAAETAAYSALDQIQQEEEALPSRRHAAVVAGDAAAAFECERRALVVPAELASATIALAEARIARYQTEATVYAGLARQATAQQQQAQRRVARALALLAGCRRRADAVALAVERVEAERESALGMIQFYRAELVAARRAAADDPATTVAPSATSGSRR